MRKPRLGLVSVLLLYTFGIDTAGLAQLRGLPGARGASPPGPRAVLPVAVSSDPRRSVPHSDDAPTSASGHERELPWALAPVEVVAEGFEEPAGVAVDEGGRIHVSDRKAGTLVRIDPGAVKTVVWSGLRSPVGLAFDAQARLIVVEEKAGRVRRLEPSGAKTVLASKIKRPRWVAVGPEGTLFVSAQGPSSQGVILRIPPSGTPVVFAEGFKDVQGLALREGSVYAVAERLRGEGESHGTTLVRIPVQRRTARPVQRSCAARPRASSRGPRPGPPAGRLRERRASA